MSRVFKTRHFGRWARKAGLSDRWFFVFGFEKNDRANVSARELEGLQALAVDLLRRSTDELDLGVENGVLQEICDDDED